MIVIGLTGGIATGKSTVSSILARRGAEVIDADQIAREVVRPGTPGCRRVREEFGDRFFCDDGSLDRKKLARHIFGDDQERKRLENLLHPLITSEIRKRITGADAELVVVDAALLYESGSEDMVDRVWVVYAEPEVQLTRLMDRDGLDKVEAETRIRAQMPLSEKCRRADLVIDNSGSLADTEKQVEKGLQELLSPDCK